jgi:hypothetical protein
LGLVLRPLLQAQTVTVKADPGPDESMSQAYMALDRDCRSLVNKRADSTETIGACKKVSDEADRFPSHSHFITRRAAYVFYSIALLQGKKASDAVVAGDKAVAVVLLGYDDGSGSSAAYGVRGQAKAFAGNLTGADQDLNKAEDFEREALSGPAGKSLNTEYTRTLKGLLNFHAQVLTALGKQARQPLSWSKRTSSSVDDFCPETGFPVPCSSRTLPRWRPETRLQERRNNIFKTGLQLGGLVEFGLCFFGSVQSVQQVGMKSQISF